MISKEFTEHEMVIPAYGVYSMLTREAGDAIKKHGPNLIDPKAELEFMMSRREVEKLKEHLEAFLRAGTNQLAFYIRSTDKE